MRRQPGTPRARAQGIAGPVPDQGQDADPGRPPRSGASVGSGPACPSMGSANTAVREGGRRALAQRPARPPVPAGPRDRRGDLRPLPTGPRRQRPRPRHRRGSALPGPRPARRAGRRRAMSSPVREYHELQTAQEGQALGDALPIGLRLLSDAAAGAAIIGRRGPIRRRVAGSLIEGHFIPYRRQTGPLRAIGSPAFFAAENRTGTFQTVALDEADTRASRHTNESTETLTRSFRRRRRPGPAGP